MGSICYLESDQGGQEILKVASDDTIYAVASARCIPHMSNINF